jgi:CheY-like chemotaxis protein
MTCRVLVVEDEIFVATEIESVVEELGYFPVGIAADAKTALVLAKGAELALVDLNLQDGPTGPELGRIMAETHGITVVYMTANPSQLGDGIPGTLGVLPKPVSDAELREAVLYAAAKRIHNGHTTMKAPGRLRLFANSAVN